MERLHQRGTQYCACVFKPGYLQTAPTVWESWGIWISGRNNTFEQINAHNNMGPGLFIQDGGNNLVLNCDSHDN